MPSNIFVLTKIEYNERKKKLHAMIRDYASAGDLDSALEYVNDGDCKDWKDCVRYMLYAYQSSIDGRLFYMAYGKQDDIETQMQIKYRLKDRTSPMRKKMRAIAEEDGHVIVHVIMDDIGKVDAMSLERFLKECVVEYGIEGITFPGIDQLCAKQLLFVEEYCGGDMEQYSCTVRSGMCKDFDIRRAISSRQDTLDYNPAVADRIARQTFWTNVMEDETAKYTDRIRASELLGRSEGDFFERVTVDIDINIKNILSSIRDRRSIHAGDSRAGKLINAEYGELGTGGEYTKGEGQEVL